MDLLDKLLNKGEAKKPAREWRVGRKSRKQLNVKVDKRLSESLHRLAREYNIKRDEIAEHALEAGCFYLKKAKANEETAKRMREHLMMAHVNCDIADDTEAALRLGENEGYFSALLTNTDGLIPSRDAMLQALQGTDRDVLAVCEKAFIRNTMKLLHWFEQNYRM